MRKTHLGANLDDRFGDPGTFLVSKRAITTAQFSPAAVSVHDNGDVLGQIALINVFLHPRGNVLTVFNKAAKIRKNNEGSAQ